MLARAPAATEDPPTQVEESAVEGKEDLEATELKDEEGLDDYWGEPPNSSLEEHARVHLFSALTFLRGPSRLRHQPREHPPLAVQ